MRYCHFGVSPVNYSDSDSDSEIYIYRNDPPTNGRSDQGRNDPDSLGVSLDLGPKCLEFLVTRSHDLHDVSVSLQEKKS